MKYNLYEIKYLLYDQKLDDMIKIAYSPSSGEIDMVIHSTGSAGLSTQELRELGENLISIADEVESLQEKLKI